MLEHRLRRCAIGALTCLRFFAFLSNVGGWTATGTGMRAENGDPLDVHDISVVKSVCCSCECPHLPLLPYNSSPQIRVEKSLEKGYFGRFAPSWAKLGDLFVARMQARGPKGLQKACFEVFCPTLGETWLAYCSNPNVLCNRQRP